MAIVSKELNRRDRERIYTGQNCDPNDDDFDGQADLQLTSNVNAQSPWRFGKDNQGRLQSTSNAESNWGMPGEVGMVCGGVIHATHIHKGDETIYRNNSGSIHNDDDAHTRKIYTIIIIDR
jgi:hypothetical protein